MAVISQPSGNVVLSPNQAAKIMQPENNSTFHSRNVSKTSRTRFKSSVTFADQHLVLRIIVAVKSRDICAPYESEVP